MDFFEMKKVISLLISCNLVMSYSDKCFYYVLSYLIFLFVLSRTTSAFGNDFHWPHVDEI